MKISKIIHSPIFPVVITGVLLIIGLQYRDSTLQQPIHNQPGIKIESKPASKTLDGYIGGSTPSSPENTAVIPAPTQAIKKKNPSFNDIILSSCNGGDASSYKGTQVQWNAQISEYAHTTGIRFRVIDDEHPQAEGEKHGHFWGAQMILGMAPMEIMIRRVYANGEKSGVIAGQHTS